MDFNFVPFHNAAQVSPVYGIVLSDFNADGKNDLFLAGNYYNREVETTRSDAGIGTVLLADGDRFEWLHSAKTGVAAYRDVRASVILKGADKPVLCIANNNSEVQFYTLPK